MPADAYLDRLIVWIFPKLEQVGDVAIELRRLVADGGDELPIAGAVPPEFANGRPDGSRRALQLSLFDVSDLANPKRTAQTPIGTAWAYSEA